MNYAAIYGMVAIAVAVLMAVSAAGNGTRRKDSRFKGWPFDYSD